MHVLWLIFFIAATAPVRSYLTTENRITDEIVEAMRSVLTKENKTTVKFPLLKYERLKCYDGVIGDLASIERIGDANLTTHGNRSTLSGTLRLGTTNIEFATCQFWNNNTDNLKGNISSHSISLVVMRNPKENLCSVSVTLNYLVNTIFDIDRENPLYYYMNWGFTNFLPQVMEVMNKVLTGAAEKVYSPQCTNLDDLIQNALPNKI